jgi:hypothetical protein
MKSGIQKESISPSPDLKHVADEDNPLAECRNLVRVLAEKTDVLYRKCWHDQDKALRIRTMSSILATLTILVDRLDRESGSLRPQEIHEDSRGFTYRAVRSCELNRICDK